MGFVNYTESEAIEIGKAYDALIQSIGETMTLEEVGYVKKAYELCCKKYDGMCVRSGRPMMLHVLEVAQICYSEMGMHSKTIVSALLHNITRCTDTTFDELKEQFGERVTYLDTIRCFQEAFSFGNRRYSRGDADYRALPFKLPQSGRY